MPIPDAPEAPVITNVFMPYGGDSTADATAQNPLPANALSVRLESRTTGTFNPVGSAGAGGVVEMTGLGINVLWEARWVSVNGSDETPGPSTTFYSAPDVAAQPAFGSPDIGLTSVSAVSQSTYPTGASSFILHVGDFGTFSADSSPVGTSAQATTGSLTAGNSYFAQWYAVGPNGKSASFERIFDAKVNFDPPAVISSGMTRASVQAPNPFPNGIVLPATTLDLRIQVDGDSGSTSVMTNPTPGQVINIIGLSAGTKYWVWWLYTSGAFTVTNGPKSTFTTQLPGPGQASCSSI